VTFTDHKGLWGQAWVAMSTCGHYAIALDHSNPKATKFQALFIPGAFATAEKIGRARSKRADAEKAAEEHWLTPNFNLSACAKGI
jgi:hypothetical protein